MHDSARSTNSLGKGKARAVVVILLSGRRALFPCQHLRPPLVHRCTASLCGAARSGSSCGGIGSGVRRSRRRENRRLPLAHWRAVRCCPRGYQLRKARAETLGKRRAVVLCAMTSGRVGGWCPKSAPCPCPCPCGRGPAPCCPRHTLKDDETQDRRYPSEENYAAGAKRRRSIFVFLDPLRVLFRIGK